MKTKLLTISFLFVLLAVATVAVVFEAKPVEAKTWSEVCFTYALTECGDVTHRDCVVYHFQQCMNPIILPDTIVVTAD